MISVPSEGSNLGTDGSFNSSAFAAIATRMISKYGAACTLRRLVPKSSPPQYVDRPCVAAFPDWYPAERATQLVNPLDRLALISTDNLVLAPNQHLDSLVTWSYANPLNPIQLEVLSIIRAGRFGPAGVGPQSTGVIYWELTVRGVD